MKTALHTQCLQTLLFLLLLLSSLTACHRQQDHLLAQADSLLAAGNADSAHALLTQHSEEFAHASRSRRMHYGLLLSDAQNRLFKPFTDDSIMVEVEEYYKDNGTNEQRIRSRYLLGSVYRDMKLPLMAQRWFRKAIDEADTLQQEKSVYLLLAKVYGQLGDLQEEEEKFPQARSSFKRMEYYAKLSGSAFFEADALRSQGGTLLCMEQYEQSCDCLNKSMKLYRQAKDTAWAAEVCKILSGVYTEMHKYAIADSLLRIYEVQSGELCDDGTVLSGQGRESYYAYKGDLYLAKGQVDSALIIYRRELQTAPNSTYKISGMQHLAIAFKELGQMDSAYSYLQKLDDYRNSNEKLASTNKLQIIQDFVDEGNAHKQAEANEMKALFWEIAFFLSIVLLLALIYITYTTYKNKAEKKYKHLQFQYLTILQEAETARERLQVASETHQNDTSLIEKLKKQLDEKVEEQNAFEKKSDFKQLAKMRFAQMRDTSIFVRIHSIITNGKMPEENDWEEMRKAILDKFPQTVRLIDSKRSLLNDREYRICLLFCFGLSSLEVVKLMALSKQSVCDYRKSLNEKMFGERSSRGFETNIILADTAT